MMSDFRQNEAGILDVFQGFLTTKTALVGYYDECREVFRGCQHFSLTSRSATTGICAFQVRSLKRSRFIMKTEIDGFQEWQNKPQITGVNRLPQRASFMPYESLDKALRGDRFSSGRCFSLDGEWKFKLFENYKSKVISFAEPKFDTSSWDEITVPSS